MFIGQLIGDHNWLDVSLEARCNTTPAIPPLRGSDRSVFRPVRRPHCGSPSDDACTAAASIVSMSQRLPWLFYCCCRRWRVESSFSFSRRPLNRPSTVAH